MIMTVYLKTFSEYNIFYKEYSTINEVVNNMTLVVISWSLLHFCMFLDIYISNILLLTNKPLWKDFIFSLSVYLIVIPLTFIVPLGLKILSDYPNMLLMFLYLNLLLWMGTEMYQSVSITYLRWISLRW